MVGNDHEQADARTALHLHDAMKQGATTVVWERGQGAGATAPPPTFGLFKQIFASKSCLRAQKYKKVSGGHVPRPS